MSYLRLASLVSIISVTFLVYNFFLLFYKPLLFSRIIVTDQRHATPRAPTHMYIPIHRDHYPSVLLRFTPLLLARLVSLLKLG